MKKHGEIYEFLFQVPQALRSLSPGASVAKAGRHGQLPAPP
ncbi:hypothetical protein ACWGIA_38730 [Streptomyces bobili]